MVFGNLNINWETQRNMFKSIIIVKLKVMVNYCIDQLKTLNNEITLNKKKQKSKKNKKLKKKPTTD